MDRWNSELTWFRAFRANGGHANDADAISAQIEFNGIEGLLALFARLDLPLMKLPLDARRPVPGRSYVYDELRELCDPISAYPEYQSPGVTTLFGVKCWIGVNTSTISIQLSGGKDGDFWVVTATDFRNARHIEAEFVARGIVPVPPAARS
jgi:hypothetical protein